MARARFELRGTALGARVRCYGSMLVRGRSGIQIGSRTTFLGGMFPTELRCADGAELVIGPSSVFNYGVSIVVRRSVRIGARFRCGSLVHVRDDDGLRAAPVTIADDVWIAHGAIVEPGTTIGAGSIVAAGTVVSGVVPPKAMAIGNPAQCIPLEASSIAASQANTNAPRFSRDEVRKVIIDWLDDTRHFGEAASLIKSDRVSLRGSGILDSLGLVQLLMMLETRFGVTINRDVLASPDSQSMKTFLDLVAGDG
jgi:maltose O-acetyltransferase